jgi:hypothetical protein
VEPPVELMQWLPPLGEGAAKAIGGLVVTGCASGAALAFQWIRGSFPFRRQTPLSAPVDADELMRDYRNLPLAEQTENCRKYEGMRVVARGRIESVSAAGGWDAENPRYEVSLRTKKDTRLWTALRQADYPNLRLIRLGARAEISGKVRCMDCQGIVLDDASLTM